MAEAIYQREQLERKCTCAYKIYAIAICLLLESLLQWLLLKYTNLNEKNFGNDTICFVMLVSSFLLIILDRFIICIRGAMPCILYIIFTLILIELTIIGTGGIITSARNPELWLSILAIICIMFIFSFVGGYMIVDNKFIFVACLCKWIFVCELGILLLLTIFLLIEIKFTYINVFSMMLYPVVFFNLSYDARYINSSSDVMSMKDCLSSALYIYGEFVLLLIASLNLTKSW